MPHFPTFPRPGTQLAPPPVDPDRARLEALRHDLALAESGRIDASPAAIAILKQEIAKLELGHGGIR